MRSRVWAIWLLALSIASPAHAWPRKPLFSLYQVVPGSPFTGGGGGSFNGGTVSGATIFTSTVTFKDGSAPSPSWNFSSNSNTGAYNIAGTGIGFAVTGSARYVYNSGQFLVTNGSQLGFSSNVDPGAAAGDAVFSRNAAGVVRFGSGAASINGFLGGGTSVASASALPVPTGTVFHVTGTTNIDSITSTNFGIGACIVMIFDGALTVGDANNLKLSAAFVTTADDTLSLCYDGTNWFETARSVN